MGRPKREILENLIAGDKFYMLNEPSFFPYKVVKQGNNRTFVEKPSGKRDYYDSSTIVKKLTPSKVEDKIRKK